MVKKNSKMCWKRKKKIFYLVQDAQYFSQYRGAFAGVDDIIVEGASLLQDSALLQTEKRVAPSCGRRKGKKMAASSGLEKSTTTPRGGVARFLHSSSSFLYALMRFMTALERMPALHTSLRHVGGSGKSP